MEKMTLTFVNVGYGEAILAECPDDRAPDGRYVLLIDGGSGEAGEYAQGATGRIPLREYLTRRSIRRVDLAVSTHIHEDHLCGLLRATEAAPPARLWQTLPTRALQALRPLEGPAESPSASKFLRALNDYQTLCARQIAAGHTVENVCAGYREELCPGLTVEVLSPSPQRVDQLADCLEGLCASEPSLIKKPLIAAADACMNNYSVILLLNYRGTRLLLPGDTNREGYGDLGPALRADLFKLGHHGQRDSVTPELLDLIAPRHAVCCASSDRRYHSASPEVLELLGQRGIRCWFSDCPPTPWGQGAPPHAALEFTVGPGGEIQGAYR